MCASSVRASITRPMRLAQDRNACPGLHRMRRDVAAEGARARNAVEQAEHMARHGMQPRALREFALHIGDEGFDRGLAATRTARCAP